MFHKKIFFIILFFFVGINSEITIYATDEIIAGCEDGYYFIEFKVEYSSPFDNYYSFVLYLENPFEIKFKCFIEYKNSSIICIGNLNSNDFDFELGEFIEFPITFPEVQGIKWDYDSFAKNIYAKGWIVEEDCLIKENDNFTINDWGLIFNITDIFDNNCVNKVNTIEYNYNFKIKGNFITNNLLSENEEEIEFLQDIWIPISIKENKFRYRKVEDISFAFCPIEVKLSKSNINNQFEFDCNIPIPEGRLLKGIIQIESFYDYFYIKSKDEIFFENIFFNINRTIEVHYYPENINTTLASDDSDLNNEINTNNTNTIIKQEETKIISVNYFILGEKNLIYCPDKPIFAIANSDRDIRLYSTDFKNYTFTLHGTLSILKYNSDLNNEIIFSLILIDKLAENEDNQKAVANCTIQIKDNFYRKITAFCKANKISEESMNSNDTDILLNWNWETNKLHNNLIIKWPDENKKIKHMYSYTINGFSLVSQNYGCYNFNFYFYIYIYNLNFEPDIEFEIQMKNPIEPKAICKIYESSILKCYLPLHQKRLEKDTKIDMMTNYTYESIDDHGNKVVFVVDDYDSDYEDFHLTLKTPCGNYFLVGLLKDAGINYIKIAIIVLGIICFIIMVIICFICFIIYKIKSRNIRGKYIRYVEERSNNINNNNNIVVGSNDGKQG